MTVSELIMRLNVVAECCGDLDVEMVPPKGDGIVRGIRVRTTKKQDSLVTGFAAVVSLSDIEHQEDEER